MHVCQRCGADLSKVTLVYGIIRCPECKAQHLIATEFVPNGSTVPDTVRVNLRMCTTAGITQIGVTIND